MDSLVERIGKIPFRLTMQAFSRPSDETLLKRYFELIRATFKRHKPPIELGEHIGSGGFADVFKATSSYGSVSDFAIKILRGDLLEVKRGKGGAQQEDEMRVKEMKRRFTNESYVQWDLSQSLSDTVAHSVVRVFDFGEFDHENNFRFILMEQMGATLRGFLNDRKQSGESSYALLYKTKLMLTIAEIISNVHTEGIFHRDIKPENILFPRSFSLPRPGDDEWWRRGQTKKIEVKLADFGTVRWVRSYASNFDGVIIGSQFYMSPEQISNPEHLDQRTDIYSFGVVCYELLTGAHPKIVNKDTSNLLLKLAQERPLLRTPPKGFEDLQEIIVKCMGNIRERYQSMEQVVTDLRRFYEKAAG